MADPISRWLPFLSDASISPEEYRRRMFVLIVAGIGVPVMFCFAVIDTFLGKYVWVALDSIGGLVVFANLMLVRSDRFVMLATRITLLVISGLTIAYVAEDLSATSLCWALLLPIVALFIFEPAEATAWTITIFAVCGLLLAFAGPLSLKTLNDPNVVEDFFFSYLLVASFAYGYEALRRRAEERARQREVRLQQFADSASDYLFMIDKDLCYSYVSPRFEALGGLPAKMIVGRSIEEAARNFNVDMQELARHHARLKRHEPYRDFRFSFQSASGETRIVSQRADPLFDDNGEFQGYIGSGTDITEQERTRKAMVQKDAELHQTQRTAAIGQLTSGIIHDFNNLLQVIIGYLELVRQQEKPDDRMLAAMDTAAHRASELTKRVLAFTRNRISNPEIADLSLVLKGMLPLLTRTLGTRIEVTLHAPAGCYCLVDTVQFESAILNLAINARDAMPGGGQLIIGIGVKTLDDRDYFKVEVKDTGEGIPPEVLEHVTEAFFSTKSADRGTGLGLSMVQGFVTQSNGHLQIDSALGQGTQVALYLPIADAVPQQRIEDECPQREVAYGTTVLVVEDNADVQGAIKTVLEQNGYVTYLSGDTDEALEVCEEIRPEILISDVNLPGILGGVELVERIRQRYPHIVTVLISGYHPDAIEGRGDTPVLHKPFTGNELIEALHSALKVE